MINLDFFGRRCCCHFFVFMHPFPLFTTDLVPGLEHGVPLRLDIVVLARHDE